MGFGALGCGDANLSVRHMPVANTVVVHKYGEVTIGFQIVMSPAEALEVAEYGFAAVFPELYDVVDIAAIGGFIAVRETTDPIT